jgi:hypothetical protein
MQPNATANIPGQMAHQTAPDARPQNKAIRANTKKAVPNSPRLVLATAQSMHFSMELLMQSLHKFLPHFTQTYCGLDSVGNLPRHLAHSKNVMSSNFVTVSTLMYWSGCGGGS